MATFVFTSHITLEADDYDSAISWFDYQMSLTQLKDIRIPDIEEIN
jgi:hypothetical protein